MLYFATLANGGQAEEAVCHDVSQRAPTFPAQTMLMSVMMLVIFVMTFVIYKVYFSLTRLRGIVDTEMNQVLERMQNRLRIAEATQGQHINDIDVLQRQVREHQGDLDTLFRAARRRTSPHPDEPSSTRRRTRHPEASSVEPEDESYFREYSVDSYQPEDESVRSVRFLQRASRSRDEDQEERNLDDESSEGETQDLEELRRRQAREAQRRMDLHAQTNNLEVYLHMEEGLLPPDQYLPFFRVDELYEQHAPLFPKVGNYDAEEHVQVLTYQRERTFCLIEGNQRLTFRSWEGLHGFRCSRIAARRNERVTDTDHEWRLNNFYQYYMRVP